VIENLASIIPDRREIRRQLGELFSLTQAGEVVHFVLTLLEDLGVHCLDLDQFFVSLLYFLSG